MQFGDANAPDTLNQTTNMMFQPCARFLKIFFDDAHIHSRTRRAHLRHIRIMLMTLRWYRFYLGCSKSEWFARSMLSLGAVISDNGINVDPAKWEKIRGWPVPRNCKDILRFLGTVNWMRDHLPDLATLAHPLTRLTGSTVPWNWTKAEEEAFDAVKALVPRTLQVIDWAKVESGEHRLFVFTDVSLEEIGAALCLGVDKKSAVPFRFYSAKFNPAQRNYDTTNQELLALVTACKQFEQHLIGWRFTIVTDHLPLKLFWTTAPTLTRRHVQMYNELSRFDFDIEFIAGRDNHIADSLSRYWEIDDVVATDADFVAEPDLDSLFFESSAKSSAAQVASLLPQFGSRPLSLFSPTVLDCNLLPLNTPPSTPTVFNDDPSDLVSLGAGEVLLAALPSESTLLRQGVGNACRAMERVREALGEAWDRVSLAKLAPIAVEAAEEVNSDRDPLDLLAPAQARDPFAKAESRPLTPITLQLAPHFLDALPAACAAEPKFAQVMDAPLSWPDFQVGEAGRLFRWVEDAGGKEVWVLVVPRGLVAEEGVCAGETRPTLREYALTATHEVLAHQGTAITLSHLRRYFWWERMAKDVTDFCRSCESCARGKASTQAPFGLLHPMPIPTRPWQVAGLDFITGLPAVIHERQMVDSILVVTDVFGKLVHLFPLSSAATAPDVAKIYHNGVYKHHGLQSAIVSDRDPKFTSGFWRALSAKLGQEVRMSSSAHPKTDSVSENCIKSVLQALRILVADNPDDWATKLTTSSSPSTWQLRAPWGCRVLSQRTASGPRHGPSTSGRQPTCRRPMASRKRVVSTGSLPRTPSSAPDSIKRCRPTSIAAPTQPSLWSATSSTSCRATSRSPQSTRASSSLAKSVPTPSPPRTPPPPLTPSTSPPTLPTCTRASTPPSFAPTTQMTRRGFPPDTSVPLPSSRRQRISQRRRGQLRRWLSIEWCGGLGVSSCATRDSRRRRTSG